MVLWLLLVVALVLLLAGRERYTDPDSPVTRPAKNAVWLSKIDAEAPIGGNDDDYIAILQKFYDQVYAPAANKPKDTEIATFVQRPDVNRPGIDIEALKRILSGAFHVESTVTAAQREQAQVKFKPSEALQPALARDEVYDRTENIYVPADSRTGELPEGEYAPVPQQDNPRRPGVADDKSTSWTDAAFYSVCEGGACKQNIY